MKKQLLSVAICILISFQVSALGYEWLGLSNTSGNYTCTDLVYHDNHIYGVGEFTDISIIIGGTTLTNSSASGTSDIFVFKADTMGTVVWAQKFGGVANESSNNMAVDNAGNALITGSFENTGVFGLSSLTSNGGKDVFVLRLNNATGNVIWVRNVGNSADDEGNDICADFNNDVYVMSTLRNQIIFAGNSTNRSTFFPGILKYDSSGNEVWFKYVEPFSTSIINHDGGRAIKYDKSDSSVVFTTSIQSGNVRLSHSSLFNNLTFTGYAGDIYFGRIKYDSSTLRHGQGINSSVANRVWDLVVNDSSEFLISNDMPFGLSIFPYTSLNVIIDTNVYIPHTYGADYTTASSSLDHLAFPKLTGNDNIYYGIMEIQDYMTSLCKNYGLFRYQKYSITLDTLLFGYNMTQKLASITSHNGSVYVGGENLIGKVCFQTSCSILGQQQLPFTINPAPDKIICPGNFTKIGLPFCDYIKGGTPPYTFSWTPTTTLLYPNRAQASATPNSTTTYYLTVTDNNNNMVYDTVTVFTTQVPLITNFTFSPLTDTVCRGDTIHFSSTYTGAPASFQWSGSFGQNHINLFNQTATGASGATLINSNNNTTNGFIFFTVYDSNGCYTNGQSHIFLKPAATIGYTATPTGTLCQGDTITLAGTGGTTTWTSNVQNNVPFVPNDTSLYIVTGTDSNGCFGRDTVQISFYQGAIVNNYGFPSQYAIAQNPVYVCLGDSVRLIAQGLNNITWSGGVQYNTWFTPTSSMLYQITGTHGNNCIARDSIMVHVYQAAISANSVSNQSPALICTGDNILLYGSGASSYTWTGGINDSIAFIPINNQTYIVTGTDTNNCSGIDSIEVIINPLPIPIIAFSTDTLYCTNVSNISNYTWTLSSNTVGTNDSILVITQNGQYVVQVTDSGGCIGYDTLQVVNLSAGNLLSETNHITLYPNPSSGVFTIQSNIRLNGQVEIYDIVGKQISTFNINAKSKAFDISGLAHGDYIIRIITKDKSYITKLTLQE